MPIHSRTQLLRVVKSFGPQIRNNSFTSTNAEHKFKAFRTKHFEEIRIAVPWGHIAGKWYGPKHERPLVGLHGWLDNAGTFDTLAPYLPDNMSFLALDMPGHGYSSCLPVGMLYHSIDYAILIGRIMQEFKWEKISLMAHSMSSMNSYVFTSLAPDKVDLLIALDILKPVLCFPDRIISLFTARMDRALKEQRRMRVKTEPPCYEWDQLVELLHTTSEKSVDVETCKFLLQRNIKPSKDDPHKYYFTRDNRLKTKMFFSFSNDVSVEMGKRITCPHLFIKALQSPYYEKKEYFDEVLRTLKHNPKFEHHEVEGTHHVHLNEPEKVATIINTFLHKWKL